MHEVDESDVERPPYGRPSPTRAVARVAFDRSVHALPGFLNQTPETWP